MVRFLFTTFEGGGHVPPALLVARRLVEQGHEVLFVSDEANRTQAERQGLAFRSWEHAPNRADLAGADDPLDEWRHWWPPAMVQRICEAVMCGPAADYAADTLAAIEQFRPDLIVSNELLLGVMMAGEVSGRRVALLTANVWCFPTRMEVPPFGPGFAPATTASAQSRDRMVRRMIAGWYDAGLGQLNHARHRLGLDPLTSTLAQLQGAGLVVLGTAQAFDYGVEARPPFAHGGPLGDLPAWAARAKAPEGILSATRPNVLVSFSTAYQGQERALARTIRALAGLDVQGIVTLGPALSAGGLPRAENVTVLAQASHDEIVPRCALVICHGGHGTVMRPLMHGVPVLCIPTGRDQPENAQRIAALGAGLRLSRWAVTWQIRRAVRRILGDGRFAEGAGSVGQAIRAEADGGVKAARLLERFAAASGS